MANLEEAIIARIKKGNLNFEILVDCEKALDYRAGKIKDLNEVVASKGIFVDVRKAKKANAEEIKKAFETIDENVIIDLILKKGEIQLTAEHKAKLREIKRKQIISFIHTNAVDAKTGNPFPPQRIEMLMEQAKIKINEFETLEHEIQNVIKELRPLIPIKLETRELEIDISASYASSVLNLLKRKTKIIKEDWKDNGNLIAIVEIPAGIQEEIENELLKIVPKSSPKFNVVFSPHLLPINRGILSTIYADPRNTRLTQEDLDNLYKSFYKNEYFVKVFPSQFYPQTKNVRYSNFCHITPLLDQRTNKLILVSAIDNMVKGASGQAVQNMNIMSSFDEKSGLDNLGQLP